MRLVDFDVYKEILHEKSGLHLTQDKAYLLESRLNPIAMDWDLAYDEVQGHPRAAGTHSIVLRMVREKKLMPLMRS